MPGSVAKRIQKKVPAFTSGLGTAGRPLGDRGVEAVIG